MQRPGFSMRRCVEARSILFCLACSSLPLCTSSVGAVVAGSGKGQLRGSSALFEMLMSEVRQVSEIDKDHDKRGHELANTMKEQKDMAVQHELALHARQEERHRLQALVDEQHRVESARRQKLEDEEREKRIRESDAEMAREAKEQKEMFARVEAKIRGQMTADLAYAHHHIEDDLGGWKGHDGAWHDLYVQSDISHMWNLLSAEAISEPLQAAGLSKHSHVLIVEPPAMSLAKHLAESLQSRSGAMVHRATFGAEPTGVYDLVIELGVLDDIAMGSTSKKYPSRPALCRDAVSRWHDLLKPNGVLLDVSSVPPVLRTPLLEKLNEHEFIHLDPKHDIQKIIVHRNKTEDDQLLFTDRQAFFADMLLHGDTNLHVFSYGLRRPNTPDSVAIETLAADVPPSLPSQLLEAIEELVLKQRPFGESKNDL